ncbi:ribose-phosphate diphosphokinase [Rubrivivax benzoatilyticus]|uniref:Ribose-phosphate diphosphokinase n=1 Tax=Rubrivivax benzoatilyticus TaxID=316997 RepID=A0ABX0HU97_9BURK|nr:ribose-phosphate diphosphokinase [Rubrivivax benzoatilyticus]EGJ08704.1 phosphoribosylpyrophosphate synthetase [Rubrivivax benzoatilyticus JA2 = ATCC BAA-35]NHK97876.1 ribose-phosphate diphosphokinase [Rubrivivax benzoatilyticus]NHL23378.1 ribose-phosphate diphosphokinase [Rubrivivax benzoatilyticus]
MSLLLAFDDELTLARPLAAALGWPLAVVERHVFPDGESRLRLPAALPPRVALLRGLQRPNERLAELMLVAGGARELGAAELTLVAPYLGYMRQDIAFTPGEVVSQRHLGRALAAWFDAVITVDPHLHRVASMAEVVPGRRGVALGAAPLLGRLAAERVPGALLVGPDAESEQWVTVAAEAAGLEHAVCLKQRHGDRDVAVALPAADVAGRAVVLLDDVASTGRTLQAATRGLLERGAASVDVAVTHALFVGDALAELRTAGVRHVWSSDCIAHESNAVSVVPLLAAALRDGAGWGQAG